MSLTIYEFANPDPITGDPIYPPKRARKSIALPILDMELNPDQETRILEFKANVDLYLSISAEKGAATSGDRKVLSQSTAIVRIAAKGQRIYISAIAA